MEHFNHYHCNHRSHILLQGGFFSRLRKVFRKKPKQSSKRDKRGKKERNKNVINDPEPTKIVNEVTDEDNVVLHLATELGRETLSQEMNERHETVTRLWELNCHTSIKQKFVNMYYKYIYIYICIYRWDNNLVLFCCFCYFFSTQMLLIEN